MPPTETIGRHLRRAMAAVTLSSAALSLAVILLSWLGSVLWRGDIVSLLTPRGIRWMAGSCAGTLATDEMVWLLLLGLAYGMAVRSGWAEALTSTTRRLFTPAHRRPAIAAAATYTERVSFRISLAVMLVVAAVVLLMLLSPHAILLSATGTLADSSFSAGIVPIASLSLFLTSLSYGLCTARFRTAESVFDAMVYGVRSVAPLIVTYLFTAQCLNMLMYATGHIYL